MWTRADHVSRAADVGFDRADWRHQYSQNDRLLWTAHTSTGEHPDCKRRRVISEARPSVKSSTSAKFDE
eukprot:8352692-Pyramimonas_sp.AAC.1